LGNLVDGVQRVPDALELKRRTIEGLHGLIQSRHGFRARPSRCQSDGPSSATSPPPEDP
jgi:hypothetical protein